jgi:hypothetical protein
MQMYLDGVLKKNELSTFYVAHFSSNVRSKAPNQKIYHNYFEQGFRYLDNLSFPQRTVLGVEQNVNFSFAGKPWTGFIDLVSEDNGKLIITDHKSRLLKPRSHRSSPTKSDLELDSYLRQLYVYSASIKDLYGRYPDALEFNCFRSQTMIQEPFRMDRMREIELWSKEEIEKITVNDDWSANPDYWRCHYLCDVCADCEYKQMS